MIQDHESIDVFIGVDVGKTNHHAVAMNRAGKKLFDKALPQDEAKLKDLIHSLAEHGRLLFVVDQPATIGALPVSVAQVAGFQVGYLPGLAMRRIADLHPGESKTDSRDAFIIANAIRIIPEALRTVEVPEQHVVELVMICGFDDDLAKQAMATSNRIRGLLTQIHPALETVIGKHLDHVAMAELLVKYPTPALFLSAFASLKCTDHVSREYYDKKRAAGKRHNQAVLALARRRCNVIFAMLRDGTCYEVPALTAT